MASSGKAISPDDSSLLSATSSPSLVSTPALSPSFSISLNRSFSSISPINSESTIDTSRLPNRSCSLPSVPTRRRGYLRPQGATFAPSAKNRDSVLSLGSIAHLQYYFARTGLLAGKGGQSAKTKQNGEYDLPAPSRFSLDRRASDAESSAMESPIEEEGALMWEAAQESGDHIMLPPTVSTYTHRSHDVAPLPDQRRLKKDLVKALENALHALESVASASESPAIKDSTQDENSGLFEIQGLHILDTTTLAIKAARLYYTFHSNSSMLNLIKPDFEIRKDLMAVMDVLRKWASRAFAGGLREDERLAILIWVSEIGMMIDEEAKVEEAERQEREGWQWVSDSSWSGRESEREVCFLGSLLKSRPNLPADHILPEWERVELDADQPTAFLRTLSDGKLLVQMHNVAIRRSKRHFGDIKDWHIDIAKPYRRAENIRFWLKAAQIRWETKLLLNVMAIANVKKEAGVWREFEDVILKWAKGVREEILRDWRNDEDRKLHEIAKSLALVSPKGSPHKRSHAAEIGVGGL